MSKTIELTNTNFKQEVIKSNLPVLVDFWAPWCGPCQMMGPIIEKLAKDYENKIKIGKFNIDQRDSQEISSKYGIQGIPAFKIFKNGEVVAEFVGARSEDDIKIELEKLIKI